MKILVTGGAGFIGSNVADAYLAAGHDVVIVDDLSTGRQRNIPAAARFYQMDIRDPKLGDVIAAEKPDVINHHAAQMDVRRSVAEPLYDAEVNVLGSINLLENARKHGVKKVIYISTGGASYGFPQYLPCDENHPIDPECQYGISKHTVEHYLFLYKHLYDLNYVVIRYPNVFGPRRDPHGEAGVVAIFVGQMLRGLPVTINGNGEQKRDFVYVADCVQANLLALDTPHNGIYNVGCGYGTSVNQIFDALKDVTGYPQAAKYGPAKAGEVDRIWLDSSKIQRDMGWRLNTSLHDGLRQTVEYFRANE